MQRAVLARELSGEVDVLIVANPCFGLDFASVAEIRAEIVADGDAELSGMLPPPWAALPGLPRMSVGWRMGFGESFIGRWGATYDALSPAARLRYQQRWPVPAGGEWTDYWETEV